MCSQKRQLIIIILVKEVYLTWILGIAPLAAARVMNTSVMATCNHEKGGPSLKNVCVCVVDIRKVVNQLFFSFHRRFHERDVV